MSNQSTSSQPRSSPSAESTTATQTGQAPRPHVHLGPAMPGISLNSYDPFLPCNSHHVRSMRRNQNQNASGNASSRTETETNRPNNNPEVTAVAGTALGDSFMAIMSQFFNPQRFTVNRIPPRQGQFNNNNNNNRNNNNNGSAATATNNNNNAQRIPPRRFTPPATQTQQTASETPRNSNWTPFPTNLPGWSSSPWTSESGSRSGSNAARNMWDVFRVSFNF